MSFNPIGARTLRRRARLAVARISRTRRLGLRGSAVEGLSPIGSRWRSAVAVVVVGRIVRRSSGVRRDVGSV